ncbi:MULTISPECIES: phage tail sheath C-terminal domain-containing protein [unclassified Burkholderia]|uniref:phage tail sheath family protein n=1 Tax=unclassified Burkholderia TaxID=2613784 RepID=UPI0007553321|nr:MULTISPECIES: phage tail sheath C-terminal domain-containing protein [unclassified Burkholderia]KVN11839.1 hypothetical protein WT08_00145 [Burkholderia sp. MSMB1552]KWZ50461.1 hypothetical protein WS92_24015 [Burkholderia sp. MSMB1588]
MPTNVVTKWPGVYIEEVPSLSLAISSGATAVPVFASGPSRTANPNVPWPIIRLNSWLDFVDGLANLKDEQGNPAPQVPQYNKAVQAALRAYFENGGGYCYLVPTDLLSTYVPVLDDVTLIVAAGQPMREVESEVTNMMSADPNLKIFTIYDYAKPDEELGFDTNLDLPAASDQAAIYYPWLKAPWAVHPANQESEMPVPPSGAIAGVYCSVDRERGVWKAPANVPLKGGLRPIFKISDEVQGHFNKGKAINMIREFHGTDPLVWGARTLQDTDSWRYVSVRRLFNSAERDIKRAMAFAVFEPNSHPTWERVRAAVDNYLYELWEEGALLGNTPEEAYFVRVGKGVTMSETDIKLGRMIVKIGMAAVRPAEFIILQFITEVGRG